MSIVGGTLISGGVRLFFLLHLPGGTFIKGATFIPDLRVVKCLQWLSIEINKAVTTVTFPLF